MWRCGRKYSCFNHPRSPYACSPTQPIRRIPLGNPTNAIWKLPRPSPNRFHRSYRCTHLAAPEGGWIIQGASRISSTRCLLVYLLIRYQSTRSVNRLCSPPVKRMAASVKDSYSRSMLSQCSVTRVHVCGGHAAALLESSGSRQHVTLHFCCGGAEKAPLCELSFLCCIRGMWSPGNSGPAAAPLLRLDANSLAPSSSFDLPRKGTVAGAVEAGARKGLVAVTRVLKLATGGMRCDYEKIREIARIDPTHAAESIPQAATRDPGHPSKESAK